MSSTLQDLKDAVDSLPLSERAELVQYVLRSMDGPAEEGAHAEWLAVAAQRMADVRAGRVVGIPAEDVLDHLLDPR
jgi:putative addiction module component (TIGR02574 family)